MKKCKKCEKEKSHSEFYKINGNSDGLSGKCKECTKKDVRANYKKNIDKYKEYEKSRAMLPHRVEARKAYSQTIKGKEAATRANRSYRDKNPNKYKAHNMVNNAVRDGKLFPLPCEVCFNTHDLHAHHDDYAKPLNIRWLCTKCHNKWHKENGEGKNG